MDDVIARVSKYGATLANGAPHQQQIGQDILFLVGALAAAQATLTVFPAYPVPTVGRSLTQLVDEAISDGVALAASHTPVMDTLAPAFRRAQADAAIAPPVDDAEQLANDVLGESIGHDPSDPNTYVNVATPGIAEPLDTIGMPGPDQRQAKKTRKKG